MNKIIYILITIVLGYLYTKLPGHKIAYPEINYTIDEFVKSLGYEFENHTVTTEDGYILQLHHIPPKKGITSKKTPVFFMHGLGCSSMTFLTLGEKSLPCLLSDLGYDVWLGNARGNTFSQKHVSLDFQENQKEFMDFSFHEIAIFDVPAIIDYILNYSKEDKLYYVGYSQGCATFAVLMSEKPEYNEKIERMIGLSPAIIVTNAVTPFIRYTRNIYGVSEWISNKIGFYEFFPRSNFWNNFGNTLCKDGDWTQQFCHFPYSVVGGFNPGGFNNTLLPFIYSTFPNGCAFRQYLHFLQMAYSGLFQKYDYGTVKNIQIYGQSTPPEYNLQNVKAPVALFYGFNDWIVTENDVLHLSKKLPNVIQTTRVPDDLFNHFDFVMGPIATEILYPDVINLLNN